MTGNYVLTNYERSFRYNIYDNFDDAKEGLKRWAAKGAKNLIIAEEYSAQYLLQDDSLVIYDTFDTYEKAEHALDGSVKWMELGIVKKALDKNGGVLYYEPM